MEKAEKIRDQEYRIKTSLRLKFLFFFPSRRRHTRCSRHWSSDVCSSDLGLVFPGDARFPFVDAGEDKPIPIDDHRDGLDFPSSMPGKTSPSRWSSTGASWRSTTRSSRDRKSVV